MGADSEQMTREEIRAALLAKIDAAWPRYKESPELASQIKLASNDELRRHLAFAEVAAAELVRELPAEERTLSPRYSDSDRELFRRVLTTNLDRGAYLLAKDQCGDWYNGPAWVPYNLYNVAEYGGNHPSERECAKTLIEAPGAEKLWGDIARRYQRNAITGEPSPSPSWIAHQLPAECAKAKASWAMIPRLTPKEFKAQRDELARRAEQLALELERFYLPRDPDECELPGLMDFEELMSQEELDRFDQAIRLTTFRIANRARKRTGAAGLDWSEYNDIGEDAKALGYSGHDLHTMAREDAIGVYDLLQREHARPDLPYGGVPSLPDMMRRIAAKFREDGERPPVKSPNLGTAERSFFTRELCKYFWVGFGDVSPAIVRDIVAMFYEGGVTEGNVSQIIAKVKAAHPLPSEPLKSDV